MGNIFSNSDNANNANNSNNIDLDSLTKEDLVNYIKKLKLTKLSVNADLLNNNSIELNNTELIPMYIELYEALVKILPEYKPTVKKEIDKIMSKKQFYVKPQFDSAAVYKQHETITSSIKKYEQINLTELYEGYKIEEPTNKFKTGQITINEYNESFNDPTVKSDMVGMSKLILKLIPTYLKLRFIKEFNKLYILDDNNYNNYNLDKDDEKINNICIGKISYAYKNKGAKDDIKSFRPIMSIFNIISHFHRILNLRLNTFMASNNYIDTTIQKGGISGQKTAILQQIFKLKSTIKHANNSGTKANILFLDITNAFGSLNRDGLYDVLTKYGVDKEFIEYLNCYYDNFQYYVKNGDLETNLISMPTGLIQGCPMSGSLFVIVLNYILKYIDTKYKDSHGYNLNDIKLLLLAFMDDICIVCKDTESLKEVYTELKNLFSQFGLNINYSKSGLMMIGYTKEEMDNYTLESVPKVDVYRYLGTYVSRDGKVNMSYNEFIVMLGKRLDSLDKKNIENSVKIQVFNQYFMPFIVRRMAMMYDCDKDMKVKIFTLVKKFNTKWGNDDKLNIFPSITTIMENTNDTVIQSIRANNNNDDNDNNEDEYYDDLIDMIDEPLRKMLARGVKISYGDLNEIV